MKEWINRECFLHLLVRTKNHCNSHKHASYQTIKSLFWLYTCVLNITDSKSLLIKKYHKSSEQTMHDFNVSWNKEHKVCTFSSCIHSCLLHKAVTRHKVWCIWVLGVGKKKHLFATAEIHYLGLIKKPLKLSECVQWPC